MGAVEHQLDVQPVIAQDHRMRHLGVAAVADEFFGVNERQVIDEKLPLLHMIAAHVGVAGTGDREGLIQEHPRPRHNPCAPAPLIATFGDRSGHGIGAVKAIVKAAPAGIGGIQSIAGVGDRHDKLRASDRGDLGIDIGGLDLEIFPFGQEIADVREEGLIGFVIMRLVAIGDVPCVNLRLDLVALGQKRTVLRPKIMNEGREPVPESIC